MALINVATALVHHAMAEHDPTHTLCGLSVDYYDPHVGEHVRMGVRQAHAEMVNCHGCLQLMVGERSAEQLVMVGMLRVQKVLQDQRNQARMEQAPRRGQPQTICEQCGASPAFLFDHAPTAVNGDWSWLCQKCIDVGALIRE